MDHKSFLKEIAPYVVVVGSFGRGEEHSGSDIDCFLRSRPRDEVDLEIGNETYMDEILDIVDRNDLEFSSVISGHIAIERQPGFPRMIEISSHYRIPEESKLFYRDVDGVKMLSAQDDKTCDIENCMDGMVWDDKLQDVVIRNPIPAYQPSEPNRDGPFHHDVFYHVTLLENVPSIQKDGLIPRIGACSAHFGESESGIYLFPNKESMDDALSNWLGEWYDDIYGEDQPLAILEIRLPYGTVLDRSDAEYERICRTIIPPDRISFYNEYGRALLPDTTKMYTDPDILYFGKGAFVPKEALQAEAKGIAEAFTGFMSQLGFPEHGSPMTFEGYTPYDELVLQYELSEDESHWVTSCQIYDKTSNSLTAIRTVDTLDDVHEIADAISDLFTELSIPVEKRQPSLSTMLTDAKAKTIQSQHIENGISSQNLTRN